MGECSTCGATLDEGARFCRRCGAAVEDADGDAVKAPAPQPSRAIADGPQGLGGWLILPAIGLFGAPVLWLYFLFADYIPLLQDGGWEVLTTPGYDVYHPLWGALLVVELAGTILLTAFDLFLLVLFFRRSPAFPRLYIVSLLAYLAWTVLEVILAVQIPAIVELGYADLIRDIVQATIVCAIWIPYFLRSRRVKNTFRPGGLRAEPSLIRG